MINAKYLRRIRKLLLIARIHELQHNFHHMRGDNFGNSTGKVGYYNRLVELRHELETLTRKIKQDENKT